MLEGPDDEGSARRQELLDGPVRGLELFSQGHCILHGSCLDIDGRVVSLVGRSGAGKSTLAAMLCQRGAKLVSDGMTPVVPETLAVVSGAAQTKLTDESLLMLGQIPSHFDRVHPESLKRYYPVGGVTTSATLSLVIIVEDAAEVSMVPIAGAQSLMRLITNAYLVEYLPPEHSATLMQRAATLLSRGVQMKSLQRVKEPEYLPATVACIERAAREMDR
jgi:hypothetical protein